MFIRFSTLLPVAAVAAAIPGALEARTDSSQCNTGSIYCCAFTQTSTPGTLNYLSGLLGIALPSASGLIGFDCIPIRDMISTMCTQQLVCCTNNNFGGLVELDCSPIDFSL